MSRITLLTIMTGPIAGLKRVIKQFLTENEIACVLQTLKTVSENITIRATLLMMEGEKESLYAIRDNLVSKLNAEFPGIEYQEWTPVESEVAWPTSQTIKATGEHTTRDSSGFMDEDLPSNAGGTSIHERFFKVWNDHIVKASKMIAPFLVKTAQMAGDIKRAYASASSLTEGLVKNAAFTYKGTSRELNTQPCLEWALLVGLVKEAFKIPPDSSVEIYKKLADESLCQISNLSSIQEKERYYVQTDDDALKKLQFKFNTMEQFFEKLKTERKRPESDIDKLKQVFSEQGILFDDLMETGDLATTDETLKEIGITQRGLRTAVLAVIRSNQ